MSEEEVVQAKEDDAIEMIYDDQEIQIEQDTIRKLENREEHSALEASMVKGEPLILMRLLEMVFLHCMSWLFYFT